MCVCLCVCACLRMCVCIWIHKYIHTYTHYMHTYIHYTHTHSILCMHTRFHTCACTWYYINAFSEVSMHIKPQCLSVCLSLHAARRICVSSSLGCWHAVGLSKCSRILSRYIYIRMKVLVCACVCTCVCMFVCAYNTQFLTLLNDTRLTSSPCSLIQRGSLWGRQLRLWVTFSRIYGRRRLILLLPPLHDSLTSLPRLLHWIHFCIVWIQWVSEWVSECVCV